EVLPNGDVKGYQTGIGQGWWGKLCQERDGAALLNKSGEEQIKPGEWNEYEVLAVGNRIRTFINGKPCVEWDQFKGAPRGIFAFQIQPGAEIEVRLKEMKLEVNPVSK